MYARDGHARENCPTINQIALNFCICLRIMLCSAPFAPKNTNTIPATDTPTGQTDRQTSSQTDTQTDNTHTTLRDYAPYSSS